MPFSAGARPGHGRVWVHGDEHRVRRLLAVAGPLVEVPEQLIEALLELLTVGTADAQPDQLTLLRGDGGDLGDERLDRGAREGRGRVDIPGLAGRPVGDL